MKQRTVKKVNVDRVKSKWFDDIFAEWRPEPDYIAYLVKQVKDREYMAPIVVVEEAGDYYIVNGHHRYYAHVKAGEQTVKCIVIDGTFEESEPLRKAEVMLKEFDQKTEYKYQFSGYLDRWAADAEEHAFINKYRPTYKFRLYKFLKKLLKGSKG
jgi:hypothetical protein